MSCSLSQIVDVSTISPPDEAASKAAHPDALDEFRQSISYLIGAISNILSIRGSRFYRQNFGIGLSEWRLMWVLGIEPAMTARRASQIMGLDKAAVSRTIAGLERRGLLQAALDPADNRQRLIGLSSAGADLYRKMIVVSRERQHRLLAPLTTEDQRILACLLHRLHTHLAKGEDVDCDPTVAEAGRRAE
ncbi:MAG TPA: MarR family transcriptional regulator [Bradyrhizobium sp.]|nr:MarR family transcriptional regulator [Bradyrhizobium sp.]